ncbi:MAG: LptF/LptG family permease [Clostridium sp.]|nr:LptF/LptG family permease [Clostridium sp.]
MNFRYLCAKFFTEKDTFMAIVKRLYTFMLQQFLPLLTMTFFICLFIVLMQFLWRFLDDLVGKGLSISVIGEFFLYAAVSAVPTALPLAVLLASLMTFGNLGEKFELTALKAAGISLFSIMKPLIIFMVFLTVGAFLFQNYAIPVAQAKMWTLVLSMRQKSPEVEIPERSFYDQIPGMNLYVEKKNPETGMLYDMIIYDVSRGLDNTRVILADSGKLNFTEDKTRLFLHLYRGEMFENLKDNTMGASSSNYLPFRREGFSDKQIYFAFDMNFNRMDESSMRNQYIGKDVAELSASIDSIKHIVDSIGDTYAYDIARRHNTTIQPQPIAKPGALSTGPMFGSYTPHSAEKIEEKKSSTPLPSAEDLAKIDIDSVFAGNSPTQARQFLQTAISNANRQRQDYEFLSTILLEQAKLMRRHDIELQRKYTYPIACLIFFFIGAPLGAIIKKGGIGTPLVISVFLFIFYYIFDNMGYKMARDGRTAVWVGIWLSSAVMLPLGIFFTYKAAGDSAVFNFDAYKNFFRAITGKRYKRSLSLKEVVMFEVEKEKALTLISNIRDEASALMKAPKHSRLMSMILRRNEFSGLDSLIADAVEHLSNTRDHRVIVQLNRLPFHARRSDLPEIVSACDNLQSLIENS